MAGYRNEKEKTSMRLFWRLCWQTAGAIGVFFAVLSLFQLTAPELRPVKEAVRACFTSDADVMPVIEWLNQTEDDDGNSADNTSQPHTTDAVLVNAPGY